MIIPDAGLNSPPILQSLFNALDLSGSHARLQVAAATVAESFLDSEEAVWLTKPSVVSCYDFGIKKILLPEVVPEKLQGTLLKIFKLAKEAVPLGPLLASKAVITLTPSVGASISMASNWYESLNNVFKTCKILLIVCWLKCIAGAWTTTARMHDGPLWPCIFGCPDAKDEVKHYFLCPILWQLSREQIGQEEDITIGERLCLQNPTRQKLRHLALCHITYHSCRNDQVIKSLMNDFCRHNDSSSSSSSCGYQSPSQGPSFGAQSSPQGPPIGALWTPRASGWTIFEPPVPKRSRVDKGLVVYPAPGTDFSPNGTQNGAQNASQGPQSGALVNIFQPCAVIQEVT